LFSPALVPDWNRVGRLALLPRRRRQAESAFRQARSFIHTVIYSHSEMREELGADRPRGIGRTHCHGGMFPCFTIVHPHSPQICRRSKAACVPSRTRSNASDERQVNALRPACLPAGTRLATPSRPP